MDGSRRGLVCQTSSGSEFCQPAARVVGAQHDRPAGWGSDEEQPPRAYAVSGTCEPRKGCAMDDLLLSLTGVAVHVGGALVLRDVNLGVPVGSIVGLVGETGSGKTMTSRVVTGMLDPIGGKLVHGSARFGGDDMTSWSERQWRLYRGRSIAVVPQSSQSSLDPLMTVRAQLEETLKVYDQSDSVGRVVELVRAVQLDPTERLLGLYPHQLSGGMRQRIMIALALAGDPRLIVADEATTALDVTVQKAILELLSQLRDERGLSILLITHDLGVIEDVADEVVVMYAGATVEAGQVRSVLRAPRHPYTRALIGARPTLQTRGSGLETIPGLPPTPADRPSGCAFRTRCALAVSSCGDIVPPLVEVDADWRVACLLMTGDQKEGFGPNRVRADS